MGPWYQGAWKPVGVRGASGCQGAGKRVYGVPTSRKVSEGPGRQKASKDPGSREASRGGQGTREPGSL